jgi:hypothetical protein
MDSVVVLKVIAVAIKEAMIKYITQFRIERERNAASL